MTASSTQTVVYTALAANSLVTLAKFAAGLWTGSSAMLSEAVHSLIDTSNEGLLLYGQHRAAKPPDELHPLGYGRELYFWSFVVAILIFAVGSGLSLYEGITHVLHPEPISHPLINYAVLGAAFLFDGYSWTVAFRSFRSAKGDLGWFEAIHRSKDPPTFIVLLEDTADLAGLLMAGGGVLASAQFGLHVLDGVASIGIGLLLGSVAAILARESKGLLIGERSDPEIVGAILAIVRRRDGVVAACDLFTVQLAPEQAIAAVGVEFASALQTPQIQAIISAVEAEVREAHPEIINLLIKPEAVARSK